MNVGGVSNGLSMFDDNDRFSSLFWWGYVSFKPLYGDTDSVDLFKFYISAIMERWKKS